MTHSRIAISLAGGRRCGREEARLARLVGGLLAERGAVLVCGGLGGAMAAACRGAAEKGGITVGILPGLDPAAANRWVRIAVPTGLGEARNFLVASAGMGLICVGGGWGTLSEIATALRIGRPVVGLRSWRLEEGRAPPGKSVVPAATPEEAVDTILRLIRGSRS